MNLTVSNIAWNNGIDYKFLEIISTEGFFGVDIAPTKIWPKWDIPDKGCQNYKKILDSFGLKAVGMQSLFYEAGPLNLFNEEEKEWEKMLNHFLKLADIANIIGINRLVFGAPLNRNPVDIKNEKIEDIAIKKFSLIGDIMEKAGLILCIEPVPEKYGGKFLCTTQQTADFINKIDHKGIKLNLDTAVLSTENIDISKFINQYAEIICHVHSSEPGLVNFGSPNEIHIIVSNSLKQNEYKGVVAIEMNAEIENIENNLKTAIKFVKNVYG